ncbi:MAG: hypothetical protein JXR10_16295 [Cyclobacteriaceae bacterium]
MMDLQAEKLELIEWLAGLDDSETLDEFITLKKSKEQDWWNEIGSIEKEQIKEGLAQADRGELISHAAVMEKYKKWL